MSAVAILCECKGIMYHASKTVLCACGARCHQQCCTVIEGALVGPKCARAMAEGEKIQVQVPAWRL